MKSMKSKRPDLDPAVAEVIRPGQSIALLQALHILTREGRLNQDSRRKLKQVYHLFQFIETLLKELLASEPQRPTHSAAQQPVGPTLADHGAGKSYLGFIIYDLFFKALGRGHIYGIETRAELVQRSQVMAAEMGFDRMSFIDTTVAEATTDVRLPEHIDVGTALHACDTATDDAIAFGLAKQARYMVLVPCCQAELAGHLRQNKALFLKQTPLAELWRHPLHTRELGSQLTNVLRCLYLESQGYEVTVTELVGWEHSMKNELILAKKGPAGVGQPKGQRALAAAERLQALLVEFGLQALAATRFRIASEAG